MYRICTNWSSCWHQCTQLIHSYAVTSPKFLLQSSLFYYSQFCLPPTCLTRTTGAAPSAQLLCATYRVSSDRKVCGGKRGLVPFPSSQRSQNGLESLSKMLRIIGPCHSLKPGKRLKSLSFSFELYFFVCLHGSFYGTFFNAWLHSCLHVCLLFVVR